jgi:hypothetical protein
MNILEAFNSSSGGYFGKIEYSSLGLTSKSSDTNEWKLDGCGHGVWRLSSIGQLEVRDALGGTFTGVTDESTLNDDAKALLKKQRDLHAEDIKRSKRYYARCKHTSYAIRETLWEGCMSINLLDFIPKLRGLCMAFKDKDEFMTAGYRKWDKSYDLRFDNDVEQYRYHNLNDQYTYVSWSIPTCYIPVELFVLDLAMQCKQYDIPFQFICYRNSYPDGFNWDIPLKDGPFRILIGNREKLESHHAELSHFSLIRSIVEHHCKSV